MTVPINLVVYRLAVFIADFWHLWLLWGVLVGLGTGTMALVFGVAVANRWLMKCRGLVMGLFSGANAAGQLAFPSDRGLFRSAGHPPNAIAVPQFPQVIPERLWRRYCSL